MPAWLPGLFKAILAIAALVAVPVQTWLEGRPAFDAALGFLAALVALLSKQPKIIGNPGTKL